MKRGTAVVIGAGIAGLCCARVLSDHFEKVVVCDADNLPADAAVRKNVPQGSHVHTLLPGGLTVLKSLFPSLEADLDARGGQVADPSSWYALTPYGITYRISRFQPTPITSPSRSVALRSQTRPLLESAINRQVFALPNVEIRTRTKVGALLVSGETINGVRTATGEANRHVEIEADLVIDASGRTSLTLKWLEALGWAPPLQSEIHCDIAYASALFEPDETVEFPDLGFLISSAKSGAYTRRAGSLVKVENGNWMVTLVGRQGDYPPPEPQPFKDYIATLHSSRMTDLLHQVSMRGSPRQYLFPKSILRHFEKLTSFPEGLLPIGDVICQLNPGYAQGMSVALREVSVLQSLLEKRRAQTLDGLWKEYFQEAYEQVRAPWVFAAMMDFTKKGTMGDYPSDEEVSIAAIKRFNKAADKGNEEAAGLVDAVFDLELPPSSLSFLICALFLLN